MKTLDLQEEYNKSYKKIIKKLTKLVKNWTLLPMEDHYYSGWGYTEKQEIKLQDEGSAILYLDCYPRESWRDEICFQQWYLQAIEDLAGKKGLVVPELH